jgi:D-alanyl-D-alanine carboxypeptidase
MLKYITLLAILILPLVGLSQGDPRKEKLQALVEILNWENQGIGSICLMQGSEIFFQAEIGPSSKIIENPIYRVGSISKTFTATLIMKAVEEGSLKLSDTLSNWFPALPNASTITIKMLLGHRSGLHNFTNGTSFLSLMEEEQTREEMLQLFSGLEPDFEPGTQESYSNTAYVVLSYILEDLYEKPLDTQLFENITHPLQLHNTYFFEEGKVEGEIFSYDWTGDWSLSTNTHPSVPMGAGGICSTPRGLCTFMRGLHQGKLVRLETVDEMLPQKGAGLGLFLYPYGEKVAYGHNGGIDGFVSHASYMPSEDLSIAVCLNGMRYGLNDLLLDLLSIYFEEEAYTLPNFDVIVIDEAILEKYAGTYTNDQFPLDIKVFVEEGALKAEATGQAAFPLNATDESSFEFKPAGIKMVFNPETNSLLFDQGGMKLTFNRD